jgi:hypothetical protein
LHYRSFYEAAKWTYEEGNVPLRRVRRRPMPENLDAGGGGKAKNRGYSVAAIDRDGRGLERAFAKAS